MDGQNGENQVFGRALSDFTFEVACGGAIRHLAHLGYTAKEIHERLSFPISYERVRQAYTRYLLEEGILLRNKPGGCKQPAYTYVQEEGKYGKKSFRRVEKQQEPAASGECAYVACNFGLISEEDSFALHKLSEKQREYLEGICWEKRTMYHLMDERMRGIVEVCSERDVSMRMGQIVYDHE
ncbi:MAG: hypothetical protein HDR21_09395 [Lachnospiraceae bacterium]|nr:hypothetical protein [Lachnospiraceae bacterium]MBD5483224.1 hypothetical protein [Lachnospiraceae bacterium]